MQFDTLVQSLYKGRLLSALIVVAVVILQTFGIELGPEDEETILNHLNELLLIIAGLFAIYSKLHEKKKLEREELLTRMKEEVERAKSKS